MTVSYDVTSLFTNVPLDETIDYLVEKAFHNDWLNKTNNLKLRQSDLHKLLSLATKNRLFVLDGHKQIDGVAMGSPLGRLMANAFMNLVEERLQSKKLLPSLYWRYVDDTVSIMPSVTAARDFYNVLNVSHASIKFTMELSVSACIAFCGMMISIRNGKLVYNSYYKPTDTGLLLHFNSFADINHKKCLIKTMLHRAFNLNSDWKGFTEEVDHLWSMFAALQGAI